MFSNLKQKILSFYETSKLAWNVSMSTARAKRGEGMSEWVIAVFIGLILFAIALTVAAPLVNGLTTGATPTISPTSTTGTLVGYVILFVVVGFILAIIAGAMYLYKHAHGTA